MAAQYAGLKTQECQRNLSAILEACNSINKLHFLSSSVSFLLEGFPKIVLFVYTFSCLPPPFVNIVA